MWEKAITNNTVLVSIMMANNEIGTVQPVKEIGRIARQRGVFFHTDAAQAVGTYTRLMWKTLNVDLMSFTAHKACGPKGIGALYARKRSPRVKPAPVIHGGGHERGIRSGTLNVPGIVGFAKALEIANQEMAEEEQRLRIWTDWMFETLRASILDIERNGHPTVRLPHNLNVHIPGIESRALLLELRDTVALSSGSACTTAKVEPSHVILALGSGEARAHCSIRFGLGRFTTQKEVETVTAIVASVHRRLVKAFTNSLTAKCSGQSRFG